MRLYSRFYYRVMSSELNERISTPIFTLHQASYEIAAHWNAAHILIDSSSNLSTNIYVLDSVSFLLKCHNKQNSDSCDSGMVSNAA